MEFPPIIIDRTLYFIRNNGGGVRARRRHRQVRWKNRIGDLAASSPAYWNGQVYVTTLTGKLVALRAATEVSGQKTLAEQH